MMFAERIDINFFDDNHIFTIFIEYCITNNITNVLFVAFGKKY